VPSKPVLCIVGLGYVGLPLAHAFARKGFPVIGYDILPERIEQLREGVDGTNELTSEQLRAVSIDFTTDPSRIREADYVILAIPTPVDESKKPDLTMLKDATATVGKNLKKGAIVVYESTVYPGVTEEVCGPILERESGMTSGRDFTFGYSPERINPGDTLHTLEKIVKIVSGQNEETLEALASLYGEIVEAGIHRAPSIKVAEMAKAIENAQRDLNIAFVNEIAILCNKIGIPTKEVLRAAATKWNFLPFQPGLVGGHCIGVDPFYLVEKAQQLGLQTKVVTAGRAINDSMSSYIATQVTGALGERTKGARVLVLGLTFKENIPDTRNSKAFDVAKQLGALGCAVSVQDPYVATAQIRAMRMTEGSLENGPFDAILLLVPHKKYLTVPTSEYVAALSDGGIFYDLKSLLDRSAFDRAGKIYLAL
jgi:UDP-N-acetyl-D-galactosamine dehydrogenase